MKHHLSKLRVNISYLKDIADSAPLETVTLQGTKVKYKVSLYDGAFSNVTETNDPTDITLGTAEKIESGYVNTYEAIVVPQPAKFKVLVEVGDSKYLYQHSEAFTFESGKLYTLNLTVGKAQVSGVNITSTGWTDGNGKGEDIKTD